MSGQLGIPGMRGNLYRGPIYTMRGHLWPMPDHKVRLWEYIECVIGVSSRPVWRIRPIRVRPGSNRTDAGANWGQHKGE